MRWGGFLGESGKEIEIPGRFLKKEIGTFIGKRHNEQF
jgi:hypothetical protein